MSRPRLDDMSQPSLLDELSAREPAQLTLEGGFVGHRQVVADQERLEREERERAWRRRREEIEAQRPQPMDPALLTPLFDE